MAKRNVNKLLRFLLFAFILVIVCIGGFAIWLSSHYKQIIAERLPGIIARSSDSVYHISFSDISINIFTRKATITDLKLWPDQNQVTWLRKQHRRVPLTLSTVSIPYLEANGIAWAALVFTRSVNCRNITVHDLKWSMVSTPHPEDSLFTRDKEVKPTNSHITASVVNFIQPDVTYHYRGSNENFDCFMQGGTAKLNNWTYNDDQTKDTSTFLYARSGIIRFNTFTFSKPAGRYVIKTPDLDFETSSNSVTLELVKIKHMVDYDQSTAKEKEIYNLAFPAIQLSGFNWNKLINKGVLHVKKVDATEPFIDIHYIPKNNPRNSRMGAYPNQLLLEVGLKTNIEKLNAYNGHFRYTEETKKGEEGTIEFTGINGHFENITNLPHVILKHKSCKVKLEGKYMNKSPISVNFNLFLTDNTGRFTVDGNLKDLNGDDVTPQAQVFTIVKVTSFHLRQMDIHIEGDETYSKGDFTVLYNGLKMSLFKFESKHRESIHGPFAFVGSALVLYSDNPMPGKDARTASTSFARDTTRGFMSTIWQNMYRAAKKTAVREQAIITLTDGPETNKGEKPKKGFFTRIFGKKKDK